MGDSASHNGHAARLRVVAGRKFNLAMWHLDKVLLAHANVLAMWHNLGMPNDQTMWYKKYAEQAAHDAADRNGSAQKLRDRRGYPTSIDHLLQARQRPVCPRAR